MPGTQPNAGARRFCLVFLALTIAWPVATVLFLRSPLYERVSTDISDRLADFYLKFRDQRYDVVVVGDSACVYGVDPSVIQAGTGLTTLNLCESSGILASRGTASLDFYLAHNSRPKALVLYLVPPDASIDTDTQNVDGIRNRIRHDTFPALLLMFCERPAPVLRALLAVSTMLWRDVLRAIAGRGWPGDVARAGDMAHLGYVPNLFADVLPDGCHELTGANGKWKRHEFIDRFRAKYSPLRIPTLVFAGPVADCDRSLPEFQEVLGHVFGNMPNSIPHALIANDGHPLHPIITAVPQISGRLAAQIQEMLRDAGDSGKSGQ